MARREKKSKPNLSSRQPITASLTPGQDFFRRVLLAFITALIVARPLVPTEDPGLRAAMPDPSGLALSCLWLVAFLGYTLWRFWARPCGVRFGLIDGALLAVVGLNLLSTLTARYKYVAWLGTWEWLTFFIAFYMVRRLAAWPGTSDGLVAAFLATAVMLSGYAAYQRFVEIPANAKKPRAELIAEMAAEGFAHAPDDHYWEELEKRTHSEYVFATFAHPNSFAGFLGLLLPAALAYAFAAWRTGDWDAMTILLVFCTGLIAAALYLTHSRGALLAVLIVVGTMIVWTVRRFLTLQQLRTLAGLAVLAVALAVIGYVGLNEETKGKDAPSASFSLRLGYWNATWKMIREHPWLGVGPGNFGRHYTAYMAPSDHEDVQNPHNFLLEMWATCGFLGMAALLLLLFLLIRRAWRILRWVSESDLDSDSVPPFDPVPKELRPTRTTPWEYYLGGMSGLILGFVLMFSTSELPFPADAPATDRFFMFIYHYHAALLRSLIWFPAFGLFMGVRMSDTARSKALIAGLVVLLLNLCVSDGISLPAVALPLWIVVALVMATCDSRLNHAAQTPGSGGQFGFLLRVLPIPVSGVLVLIYAGTNLQPTAQGARMVRRSLHQVEDFAQAINPPPGGLSISEDKAREIRRDRIGFIRARILQPLNNAAEANPDDMRYVRMQADWTRVIWQLARGGEGRDTIQRDALALVAKAISNDPMNRDNWLTKARLELIFAQSLQLESFNPSLAVFWPWGPFFNLQLPTQPLGALVLRFNAPAKTRAGKAAQAAWADRAEALEQAVKLGPTQLLIRYELVAACRSAGQAKKAQDQARELLRLDGAVHRSRRLPVQQREQVRRLLDPAPAR